MVNFHDSAEVARDFAIVVKVAATLDGLYIWEFFSSLDYEWNVIRGRQPYRWTIWIYSTTRLSTLLAVILNLITNDMSTSHNCQALTTSNFLFPNIALAFASLLVVVRIAAVWNVDKVVVTFATGIWVANFSLLILAAARLHSTWIPEQQSCSLPNIRTMKLAIISMLATDITLIAIMLVGLLRLRRRGGGWFALGRLLWKQGVLWLLLAIVAELMPVIFVCLNLNDALNMMFFMPALATMSIAATRMYRSLVNFGSHTDIIMSSGNHRRSTRATSHGNFAFNTRDRVEVAVHTTYEHHLTPPKDPNVSFLSMEDQPCDKISKLSLPGDVGSNTETGTAV